MAVWYSLALSVNQFFLVLTRKPALPVKLFAKITSLVDKNGEMKKKIHIFVPPPLFLFVVFLLCSSFSSPIVSSYPPARNHHYDLASSYTAPFHLLSAAVVAYVVPLLPVTPTPAAATVRACSPLFFSSPQHPLLIPLHRPPFLVIAVPRCRSPHSPCPMSLLPHPCRHT